MFALFTFNFVKRRIRPPKAWQEVSNINHFGSVSDSLGRLAASSECMASAANRVQPTSTLLDIHTVQNVATITT